MENKIKVEPSNEVQYLLSGAGSLTRGCIKGTGVGFWGLLVTNSPGI